MRKPVFNVSKNVRLKLSYESAETSQSHKIANLEVADSILPMGTIKALISLCRSSADQRPFVFLTFSHDTPNLLIVLQSHSNIQIF